MDTTYTKLNVIQREVQSWIDWDKRQRDSEGLETTPDTHIMNPPKWPSHGQLQEWVKALNSAQLLLIEKT